MEILEDMEKEELKYVSAANLAGGLAYIFTDIATTGEINLLSVAAFVIALLTVLGIGYLRTRKH
ncbi:MAG: hypothetical protein ABEJ93_05035 [Candidatus Nanohalobium sp.]